MLPFVLLFATSLAFASPVTSIPFPLGLVQMPETNGAIRSPLTMILRDYSDALEVHHWLTIFNPVFGSEPVPPNFVPRPPEYYNIGRSTIW